MGYTCADLDGLRSRCVGSTRREYPPSPARSDVTISIEDQRRPAEADLRIHETELTEQTHDEPCGELREAFGWAMLPL
jgi:hypothetical protein